VRVTAIGGRKHERRFTKRDQFGAELLYFSSCVLEGRDPEPSGLEWLIYVSIIRALYDSAETGKPVTYKGPEQKRCPSKQRGIRVPAVPKMPKLVHASSPSED
jgi:glucose-fructose oxidoreductase